MSEGSPHGLSRSGLRTGPQNAHLKEKELDIRVGSMVWLPSKVESRNHGLIKSNTAVEEGYHNHPVVIYAIAKNKDQVLALIVRSFNSSSSGGLPGY